MTVPPPSHLWVCAVGDPANVLYIVHVCYKSVLPTLLHHPDLK